MRSTKASNAVARLKTRSGNEAYSMVNMADGRFYLVLSKEDGDTEQLSQAMELDDFVAHVDSISKQAPKKASKLDQAFEARLHHSKSNSKKTPE
jgi:crotonobetainyl-CoA:carnitine CoA-transferase CaiB-like acyl-CoA transferase